ncbi:calcium-binding protein [Kamptonema formosum]|uniref:calcium-binding protein n=1 Tax=Kamptonema formosum TaxID=331992 RepID=UPI00034A58CD|nr:calcium-binding protein [Oscillatoria sp. PCC 10802]
MPTAVSSDIPVPAALEEARNEALKEDVPPDLDEILAGLYAEYLEFLSQTGGDTVQGSIIAGSGSNVRTGTEGDDTLTGTAGNDSIEGLAGDDSIVGNAGQDTLAGSEGNDTITGDDGNDLIFGNQDIDSLLGGLGNDCLLGGQDGDSLLGNEGADYLNGNRGSDTLLGGAGNDTLQGGRDDDSLIGDAGDDTLSGDRGADTLTGGNGDDVFAIGDSLTGGDLLTDFDQGQDVIALTGNLTFQDLNIVRGTGDRAGDLIIQLPGTGNTTQILAILQGGANLTLAAGDFITLAAQA